MMRERPCSLEEALHTYFVTGDIHQVTVTSLDGTTYIDKADGFRRKQQGNEPISIAKETDQVHLSTSATCGINDPSWSRRIILEKSGSDSTVVWNPWIEKPEVWGTWPSTIGSEDSAWKRPTQPTMRLISLQARPTK
jgi:glucose-6-phosphate 1-epimerase